MIANFSSRITSWPNTFTPCSGSAKSCRQAPDPQEHLAVVFPRRKIGVLGLTARAIEPAQDHGGEDKNFEAKRFRCPTCASDSCRRSRSSTPTRPCAKRLRKVRRNGRSAKEARRNLRAYAEPDATSTNSHRAGQVRGDTRGWRQRYRAPARDRGDALRLPPWTRKSGRSRAARNAASRCAGCCSPGRYAAAG